MDDRGPRLGSERKTQKFGGGSLILIGCCVAVAIQGIFVGVIVVYGGTQVQ